MATIRKAHRSSLKLSEKSKIISWMMEWKQRLKLIETYNINKSTISRIKNREKIV